jgi:hypothetical protein
MAGHAHRAPPGTTFERRTAVAAIITAIALVIAGLASALVWPEILAESGEAGGAWPGALLGLAMIVLLVALPQLLFGLALGSGRPGPLRATLIGAPVWALYVGLTPILSVLVDGWDGLVPLMVIAVAVAAVVDVFVTIAARHELRRIRDRAPVAPAG